MAKFQLMLFDVFERIPGQGRRIAIMVLTGEGNPLLPFERNFLVKEYDCQAIVLYTRSDEKAQYFIEH